MRIGCCANMVRQIGDDIGIERLETIAAAGYDYIELPLAQMIELCDEEFESLTVRINKSGICCEVCNNFFPSSIILTGNRVDQRLTERYVDIALERVKKLGVSIIVFGSSEAKNVPEGFEYDSAWKQIVNLLRMINKKIAKHNINIVIEPLCKAESNIVNNTREGLKLTEEVNREHIKLLVDFYHMNIEKEDMCILEEITGYLQHIHIANPNGRVFPHPDDGVDYKEFFRNIKQAGYNGRVSIEAYTDNFEQDIITALETMHTADL